MWRTANLRGRHGTTFLSIQRQNILREFFSSGVDRKVLIFHKWTETYKENEHMYAKKLCRESCVNPLTSVKIKY